MLQGLRPVLCKPRAPSDIREDAVDDAVVAGGLHRIAEAAERSRPEVTPVQDPHRLEGAQQLLQGAKEGIHAGIGDVWTMQVYGGRMKGIVAPTIGQDMYQMGH